MVFAFLPNISREDVMEKSTLSKERRKYPRFNLDFPLEYRVSDGPSAFGGIVVDGSEIGLRIHSVKNMSVGAKLNITVIFPKEFQVANFDVVAEIIWKENYSTISWDGYRYGLKFVLIKEEDLQKLKQLLNDQ
jgi:hypothetical protein